MECVWSRSAVCGPLVQNVGLVGNNVGLRHRLLSANLVPFLPCLWSQALLFVVHYNYRAYKILEAFERDGFAGLEG
jgi:hypothetical protein